MLTYSKINIIGVVGAAPIERTTKKGFSLLSISLATHHRDNEGTNVTDWHSITIWDKKIVEYINNNAIKVGDYLYVEGNLIYNKYKEMKKPEIHVGLKGVVRILKGKSDREDSTPDKNEDFIEHTDLDFLK